MIFSEIEGLVEEMETIRGYLKIEEIEERIKALEEESGRAEFWSDPGKASEKMKELGALKKLLEDYRDLVDRIGYVREVYEMAETDPDMLKELEEEVKRLKKDILDFQIRTLFTQKEDVQNAFLEIHPGAGGTESQDWAEMLLKMYIRWAEKKGFKVEILDYQKGDVAGIKSATLHIKGPYAYGYLKGEKGVHRLVRISPFDANNRRHTSFAAVTVYPEMPEVEVEIREDEIEIETFRSGGPGGQHMQKNETAVRVRHIPTGITVVMQSERSQHQNKENALKILRARLYEYYKRRQEEELEKLMGPKSSIEWGHQIRSYILHPYKLVKDHRTGYETGNAEGVLEGDLDEFIKAYLVQQKVKG
ncbi:MAG: peptide chain release factor 2 [candidate division WOR-3 bacterium]